MAFENTVRDNLETSSLWHKAPTSWTRTTSVLDFISMPTAFALRLDEAGLTHTCEASKALAACALGESRSLDAGAVPHGLTLAADILPFTKCGITTEDAPDLLAS